MSKIIIVVLGISLTTITAGLLWVGMAFSGEAHRGPGDAVSTFWICLAWAFSLLPAAAAVYKVNIESMSIWLLLLCWLMGPAGAIAGALGHDFFFPRYRTTSNSESINRFQKFQNANAEFAKEQPAIVLGLFQPIFDQNGMRNIEFEKAEERVLVLAKAIGSPIYITQEDGKGDRVILAYPYEVDSYINIYSTTKPELELLTSGKPVSPGFLKFLSALPLAK